MTKAVPPEIEAPKPGSQAIPPTYPVRPPAFTTTIAPNPQTTLSRWLGWLGIALFIAVLFTPGTAEPQIPKLTAVSDWPDDAGLSEASHGRRPHAELKLLRIEPFPQPPPVRKH